MESWKSAEELKVTSSLSSEEGSEVGWEAVIYPHTMYPQAGFAFVYKKEIPTRWHAGLGIVSNKENPNGSEESISKSRGQPQGGV